MNSEQWTVDSEQWTVCTTKSLVLAAAGGGDRVGCIDEGGDVCAVPVGVGNDFYCKVAGECGG